MLAKLHKQLLSIDKTVATAESCTGGLIAAALTSTPGSSAYMLGGTVAYANRIKEVALGVEGMTIKNDGAVSREVAHQMAEGCRKVFASDFAVATTGIAGPDGGTKDKPVGTVWFAISGPNGTKTELANFHGSRDSIRSQSVDRALQLLWQEVQRI